jgi:hypothetical protein
MYLITETIMRQYVFCSELILISALVIFIPLKLIERSALMGVCDNEPEIDDQWLDTIKSLFANAI